MRAAILILIGTASWAICLGLAQWLGKPGGTAVEDTTLAFITVWFLATATNLWAGVAKAGYTLREELPLAALIFGVPAAIAFLVRRRFF